MATKKTISAAAVAGVTMAGLITSTPVQAGAPGPCDLSAKITEECEYEVPDNVTLLGFEAAGGAGGSTQHNDGGAGAIVKGKLPVTPGRTLYIKVAGAGADANTGTGGLGGYSGGGAGGDGNCATRGGASGGGGVTLFFEDETILVAAGGGSGAAHGRSGVAAGQNANGDGSIGLPNPVSGNNFGSAGGAGTTSAAGEGGARAVNSSAAQGDGGVGTFGTGGKGGTDTTDESCAGSGGGAGYYGGGGGGSSVGGWAGASGGSGSSFVESFVIGKSISTNPTREAGWVTLVENPSPGPGPVAKKPGKPTKVKVSGKPNAAKHVVSWHKSKNATKATRYTVKVFKPRSTKSVILLDKTKGLKVTLTRKQLLKAWKKSLKARGEVTGVVSFRVTITATTGSKRSAAAVTKVLVKV